MSIKVIKNSGHNSVQLDQLEVGQTFTWDRSSTGDLFIVTEVNRIRGYAEIDALNLSKNGAKYKFKGSENVTLVDIEIKIL